MNAIRSFTAAARLLSFSKAAKELHVTQAAVSFQVRQLEDDLGVKLFRRLPRKLALTMEGQRLLVAAEEAFEGLRRAVGDIRHSGGRTLTVTSTPAFGTRWIAPRLGRFWRENPDVDLRLHHSTEVMDLRREGIDIAVRWGRGVWPGLTSELLRPAERVPITAPGLLGGKKLPVEPVFLAELPLLHEENFADWGEWLRVIGVDERLAHRGLIFDDENGLLQATLAGQGVALLPPTLVHEEVGDGRLVMPCNLSLDEGYAFYLVYQPEAIARPAAAAFRKFLLSEAAKEPLAEIKGASTALRGSSQIP